MAEIVYMPKLSDTMTEGVVAAWNKKVGDVIKSGEVLAEIETDKATMEFESFYDGVLLHIGVEVGKSAPVNTVLAIIGQAGEDITSVLSSSPAPVESFKEAEKPSDQPSPVAPAASPVTEKTTSKVVSQAASSSSNGRIFASPLAKKLADEKGIDIGFVSGTGDGG
ncbi:MAG: biotin/lipoyl-containing protein, partial [Crocinitomicaceae bacterium]